MPEIIGPFNTVMSTMPALDVHVSHLRHLSNTRTARDLLHTRYGFRAEPARETAKLVAAHVQQALEFHDQSRTASTPIRPVLQYYSFLNLAVAAILAYRPTNFEQYRRHGVEDCTHALGALDLSSVVLKVNRGAVPLFHTLISDVSLQGAKYRLGQLAAGFHMVGHELEEQFGKTSQTISVEDKLTQVSGQWYSEFVFTTVRGPTASRKRLERAMPLLTSDYRLTAKGEKRFHFRSNSAWPSENAAQKLHRQCGMKLINFGGHYVISASPGHPVCVYTWCGVSRVALLPTLTSVLLTSFALASICRYRPSLLQHALASPVQLLLSIFVQEADGIYIPALRNLLYCEEIVVGHPEFT